MYIYAGLYGVENMMIYYNVYRSIRVVIVCKYSIHRSLIHPSASEMTQVVFRRGSWAHASRTLRRGVAWCEGRPCCLLLRFLNFDHSQVHLFAYVVDDHKEMIAFLKVSLVICRDGYDSRVVFHNNSGELEVELEVQA